MNGCECVIPEGGFCDRHSCNKGPKLVKLCRTNPKYFRKWEGGVGPGQVRQLEPTTSRPKGGVGTELKALLAKVGIKATGNCNCNRRARIMDEKGPSWCQANEETIVDWLEEEARHRKLPFVRMAGRILVRRAIRNAKDRNRKRYPRSKLPLGTRCLTQNTDVGIVTGAHATYWPCLGALAIGAYRQGVGLAIADNGLLAWQHCELTRVGVRWIEHDKPSIEQADVRPDTVADLNAWWKPWICKASPFYKSLWIDSDAVLVGDPHPGFAMLEAGPWVSTQARFYGAGEKLYNATIRRTFGTTAFDILPKFSEVNTGVFAWIKGEPLIEDWITQCSIMLQDIEGLKQCSVRDQSAYVVMLCSKALQGKRLPILLEDPRWNWPADDIQASNLSKRKSINLLPELLLEEATNRNEGAIVVHWLGYPKPWHLQDDGT